MRSGEATDRVSLEWTVIALGMTAIGFRQRPRQHGGCQVEAMNLSITAATLAGCSSATQCPLSAMMVVAT
jgi:hypothetical protein